MKLNSIRRWGLLLAVAVGGCVSVVGCGYSTGISVVLKRTTAVSGASLASAPRQSAQGYSSTDDESPLLPDPAKTPGDTLAVTASDVCQPGYAHAVRNVPSDVKRQVYESYGILHHTRGQFEVDHLISLELGGSNSVRNLWPESYRTQPWNARVKDQLEDRLHDDVCSGQMDLAAAQHAIAGNWIDTYKREFHTQTPFSATQYGRRSGKHRHRGDEYVRAADESPDNGGGAGNGDADASAPPNVAYPNAAATAPLPIAAAASSARSAPQPSPSAGANSGEVWVNLRSHRYFNSSSRYYGKTKRGQYMTESDARAAGYTAAKPE